MAKTLIQIGHEPIKATQTKSFLFGRPQLSLPSVFIYIGHIRKKDGFFGMYRGLIPKLTSMGVSAIVSDQFQQNWPKSQCKIFLRFEGFKKLNLLAIELMTN